MKNGTTDFEIEGTGGIAVTASAANPIGVPNTIVNPDDVTRIFSGELLRARLTGREAPLSANEARALASVVVANLTALYSKLPFHAAALTSALHLGLGPYFGYSGVKDSKLGVHCQLRSTTASGPGQPNASAPPAIPIYQISLEYKHASRFSTKVVFEDLNISNPGGYPISTIDNFSKQQEDLDNSVADLDSLTDAEFEVDDSNGAIPETTWKQRYMKLRTQMQKRERSISQYKRKILESVMADI
jgi:hypothetical protein